MEMTQKGKEVPVSKYQKTFDYSHMTVFPI